MFNTDKSDINNIKGTTKPFEVKDCVVIALATGIKAGLLQELRNKLVSIDISSIYHHFWGGLLQTHFDEREYNNDFAIWAYRSLHDPVLAERLSSLNPSHYDDLNKLRSDIIEVIDNRIDEADYLLWSRPSYPFEFIRSQLVIFDTNIRLSSPEELKLHIPSFTIGSIFYHFIDARRRTYNSKDDFSDWLASYGNEYDQYIHELGNIDPFFDSLDNLKSKLTMYFFPITSRTSE